MRPLAAVLGALALLPALPARAGDPVREAWAGLAAARREITAAAMARDEAKGKAAQDAFRAAGEKFRDLFAGADWSSFDPKADKDLLSQGLTMVGAQATVRKDGALAVRAYEHWLAVFPGDPGRKHLEVRLLARAYLLAGQAAKGVGLWEKHAADADPSVGLTAGLALGDARCAAGDLAAARACWTKVKETPPEAGPHPSPADRAREDAGRRLSIVGSPAPEIDAKTWIGGAARPLSAMKGRVVLLDFFDTASAASVEGMADLDRWHRGRSGEGLAVVGVARVAAVGYLPRKGAKDPLREGEMVKGLDEAGTPGHLAKFRENLGLDLPFAVAPAAAWEAWGVRAAGARFLVDREGRVAYARLAGDDETLLATALDRLLRAPAPGGK